MPRGARGVESHLDVLARRDLVRLVVVDAPAGHGRYELVRTAMRNPVPGLRDVVLASPNTRMTPDCFVDATARALAVDQVDEVGPPHDRGRLVLAAAVERDGPVCLCVDDVHRGGEELLGFLGELARVLPDGAHLLLSGVGLGALRVAELVADGDAARLDAADLRRVVTDPELDRQLLSDAAIRDLGPAARQLLACLVGLDQRRRDVAEAIAEQLGAGGDLAELERLPDVSLGDQQVFIGDTWRDVDLDTPVGVVRDAAVAAATILASSDDLEEAGRLALFGGDSAALRSVVRSALAVHPPVVGAHALRSWHESGLLPDDDPHAWWLDAACRALHGEALEVVRERYDAAWRAFGADDDVGAEIATGLALGIVARRLDDLATLARLVDRSRRAAATGEQRAVATGLLGEALVLQMSGDPAAALEALDRVPSGSLEGDWAAQHAMMRGTNLLLCGRTDEAIAQLDAATGSGSAWSYATALQLLGIARWAAGECARALDDLEVAAEQARSVGALAASEHGLAIRAVMAAALGHPDARRQLVRSAGSIRADDETVRLIEVARVLDEVASGRTEVAAELAARLPVPRRAVLSAHWTVALTGALVPERSASMRPVVDAHPSLEPARQAGSDALAFLRGGPPAPPDSLRHLPVDWCDRQASEIQVVLMGTAVVLRDGRTVQHAAWERARVRELCCYLALCPGGSRELAAMRLWPDLEPAAASRNLRVTLSHLLDVLDPERRKGDGSELLVESGGTVTLLDSTRLRIDVRDELADAAVAIDACTARDDRAAMAAARRLVRRRGGPLAGGATVGPWAESVDRSRRDQVLRAVTQLGPIALRHGDPALAERLALRGLLEDPWAERLHQLVVRSRLERDDLDGARRALREALDALAELEVRPERTTFRLARDLGLERMAAGG